MANLIAPGTSVTINDTSFYTPGTSKTVPLFFIATADNKTNINGVAAAGTYESNVVRTVTSLNQSLDLYGIPRFLEDSNGNQLNGDARNEYGLFGLNQFLGVGETAYVIRADVNLNDDIRDVRDNWNTQTLYIAEVLDNNINTYIQEYNESNQYVPGDVNYKETVTKSELMTLVTSVTETLWKKYSFRTLSDEFLGDIQLNLYPNGDYSQPPIANGYSGFEYRANDWNDGELIPDEWTANDAYDMFLDVASDLQFTIEFRYQTSLGNTDAARRNAIVTSLQSAINLNTDIRSETYEYNLILCPGYSETVDELINLNVDIGEEAFVIGATPMGLSPDEIVAWAATTSKQASKYAAYYYPHGLASNLDGKNVMVCSSGIAARVYAYSDEATDVWYSPAGTQRGVVTGVSNIGYYTGTPGTATTFVPVALNVGQQGNLYKSFTNINPIVFFQNRGFVINGAKTTSPESTALDRVKASRTIVYIKRSLRQSSRPFVFQINDQRTRDSLKAMADNFLNDLITKRALYDFVTVSDESNNTPARIDRNEMYLDIALKLTKDAEFIYIPINVVATGTEI